MSLIQEALACAQRAASRGQRGDVISTAELDMLVRDLEVDLPPWLSTLFTSVPLSGLELAWREGPGPDGIVSMRWSDANNIRSESLDCYPGCAIASRGYINVASCLEGSGDPYFICVTTGEDPPLYRVYHDVSDQPEIILAEGLHEVTPSLSAFFRAARTGKGADN